MSNQERERHAADMRLRDRASVLKTLHGRMDEARRIKEPAARAEAIAAAQTRINDYWEDVRRDLQIMRGGFSVERTDDVINRHNV